MADDVPFKKTMEFAYGEPREMAPGIVRLVANNPGPFTFKGTNTYLVGTGHSVMLIDPGPEDDAHFNAIMAALGPRKLSHIVVTHTHRDHIDGLPRLAKATGAPVAAYGRTATATPGAKSPSGGEAFNGSFTPDIVLRDGDLVSGDGSALKCIFTPGHAPDHLCFELVGTKLVFSGDHVMSWNTSVVAPPEGHMGDYMRSLFRLLERQDEMFLPGHGGRFEQPQRLVKAFIIHRQMREQAILDCIGNGHDTIDAIVPIVYRGLEPRLVNAASLSVEAHVRHLQEQGRLQPLQHLERSTRLTRP
ncbi:MAG TPA: MBL fold metallo-hydrolase [Hyphomicrobiaceae bacterium]|nr:MBL fold metallo-hydrolase [Hyphomicrobiaceae bacterium]